MRRTNNYVLREVSDVPLLICSTIPNGECWIYELNSVGKLIWEICEKYKTVDDMVIDMDNMFNEPLSKNQKNAVRDYCNKICDLGLLEYGE